jgi:hypothetical protein
MSKNYLKISEKCINDEEMYLFEVCDEEAGSRSHFILTGVRLCTYPSK